MTLEDIKFKIAKLNNYIKLLAPLAPLALYAQKIE